MLAFLCSLNGKNIGAITKATTLIASLLSVNAVVTDINLQNNAIGALGATAIAEALKVNRVLTTLK